MSRVSVFHPFRATCLMKRLLFAFLAVLIPASTSAAVVPSEYTLINITGWSELQLADLPHFDRYVPVDPLGAGTDFVPLAHNGLGLTVGNRDFNNGSWVQGSGAYVKNGVQTDVTAWLRAGYWFSYSWSNTYWDGSDYHFQNGFVTHSPAQDTNFLGQVVGYATVPGSGSGPGSSSGYEDHIWLRDSETGGHVDLTPEASRAEAKAINDHGQIVGFWRNAAGYHPFVRHADGSFEDFTLNHPTSHTITPTVINNRGLVAGNAIIYTTPLRDQRPWVCESGTVVSQLPLPDQNSPDVGTITDVNDHGILVGEAHKAASFTETSAVRWSKDGGAWLAEDLNELIDDNMDFIVDRALAVNDAGHILCSGHADGVDTLNTHHILLTPTEFPEPSVTGLPVVQVTSTGAVLRAKVNAGNQSTSVEFEYGPDAAYGSSLSSVTTSGTLPVMAGEAVGGLAPATTYHYRGTATNPSGTTEGEDLSFTTAWDWTTWAAAEGVGDPDGDSNGNGIPDLVDYATGHGPPMTIGSDGTTTTLVFQRSLVADGVVLTLQVSDDLSVWLTGPSYDISGSSGSTTEAAELSRVPAGSDAEVITISTPHHFARLKAELP